MQLSCITVEAALALPELRRGLPEVVAGRDSLDRSIRWVHAGEIPDIASVLRGGELLLTTGMGIGSRPADQRRFVAELASRNVAGLVVELGRTFSGSLPQALVTAAQKHALPLVELHAEVRFVTVTEAVHTAIVSHDYDCLRQAEDLHRRFAALMIEGGGIPDVLSVLAETLGNPVFLESGDGNLLAYAPPGSDSTADDPISAWEQAGDEAAKLGVTAAVPGDGRHNGRLVVLPVERALDSFCPLALDRAASIVALALLRTRQETELLARGRGDFLARLADGRIDPAVAEARAHDTGFARSVAALLPVAGRLRLPCRDDAGDKRGGISSWTPALRDIEDAFASFGLSALVGIEPLHGDLLAVVALRDAGDRSVVGERVAAAIHEGARRRVLADAVVAIGANASWSSAGDGLRDAIEASAVAAQLPDRAWHDATDLTLERLLWRLRESDDLRRYVHRLLEPALAHDAQRKQPLLPTLEALCAHGGRKAEAARALHLNRQSLYDRIGRLEQVLGADLSDSQTLLSLHLAIRAHRHLAAAGAVR